MVEIKGLDSKVAAAVDAGDGFEGSRSRINPLALLLPVLLISEIMLEVVFLVEISFSPKASIWSADDVVSSESSLTILKIEGVKGLEGLEKSVDVNVVEVADFGATEAVGCAVMLAAAAGSGGAALTFLLVLSS
jgi:hypothetical protein